MLVTSFVAGSIFEIFLLLFCTMRGSGDTLSVFIYNISEELCPSELSMGRNEFFSEYTEHEFR